MMMKTTTTIGDDDDVNIEVQTIISDNQFKRTRICGPGHKINIEEHLWGHRDMVPKVP